MGACPDDYTCASDQRCHKNGSPAATVCGPDGGVDAPGPADAPIDADTTPPTVIARSPVDGGTGVLLDAVATATFSEPVFGLSGATFTLSAGGSFVAGTVTYGSTTHVATFTPSAPLVAGTTYTAALTSSISDAAGNALLPVSWQFSTVPDTTPPMVTMTVPAAGDTAVSVATTIFIMFDEPVANVDTTSLTVMQGATPIAGTITPMMGGMGYTFTPSAALPAASTITVTLSSAITDTAGNPLATVTVMFTTA